MAHLLIFVCVCDIVDCTALWFRVKGGLLGATGRERDFPILKIKKWYKKRNTIRYFTTYCNDGGPGSHVLP